MYELTDTDKNKQTETSRILFALDSSDIGVWDYDPIGKTIFCNDTCKALFGFAGCEVITYQKVLKHIHAEDLALVDAAIHAALNPEIRSAYEIKYRVHNARTGSYLWVKSKGKAQFDNNGVVQIFAGTISEIYAPAEMMAAEEVALANKKLLQSESFSRSIIRDSAVAQMVLTGEDMILDVVNEKMLEIFGRTNDILGMKYMDAIPELKTTPLMERLRHVLLTGKKFHQPEEQFTLLRNGQPYVGYYKYTYQAITNNEGKNYGVICTCTEVSDQVYARKKIAESEARFRSIVEQAPMAIALLSGREMVIEVGNEKVFEVWGKDRSVTGMKLLDALPEIKDQGFIELLEKVFDTGEAFLGNSTLARLKRNGNYENVYFDFSYTPLRDIHGTITGVMVLATEVTGTVLARLALEESEARFRSLVEEASVASCLFVGRELRIEVFNEIMLGYWGKDASVKNKPLAEAVPELIGQPFLQILDDVYTSGVAFTEKAARAELTRNGVLSTFYFDYTYKPMFNAQGEVYAIIDTAVDVTDQVLARRELEQFSKELSRQVMERTKDLKRSNEDLMQFAHVASHDLKEPVRKIKTFANRLQAESREILPPKSQTYLDKIQNATDRMYNMIEGVLAYSELNTPDQSTETIDLNSIFTSIESDLEITIQQKQATIDKSRLPVIEGAQVLIYQLFYNLISNSLKFSKPDEAPVISIGSELLKQGEKELVKITITDNGIGFDPSAANKIFGTFTRLHSKDAYDGTGLGLALCEKIAIRHKGAIEARSEQGKGAVFTVILPLQQIDFI